MRRGYNPRLCGGLLNHHQMYQPPGGLGVLNAIYVEYGAAPCCRNFKYNRLVTLVLLISSGGAVGFCGVSQQHIRYGIVGPPARGRRACICMHILPKVPRMFLRVSAGSGIAALSYFFFYIVDSLDPARGWIPRIGCGRIGNPRSWAGPVAG